MSQFSRKLLWTCSFVFSFTAFTLAAPLSDLRGTVFDPSGAAIANAQVELLENGVPVASATTDAKGQYFFSRGAGPALWLRVSDPGFSTVEKPLAPSGNGGETTIDIVLPIATLSEQITVTFDGCSHTASAIGRVRSTVGS